MTAADLSESTQTDANAGTGVAGSGPTNTAAGSNALPGVQKVNGSEGAPVLSVARGEPTAEELAALIAVIARKAGERPDPSNTPPKFSGWTDRTRYVNGHLPHSSGGWRASALPR